MNRCTVILLVALSCLLVLAGCMTPAHQATALDGLEQMRATGAITPEQFEAMRDSILGAGPWAWVERAITAVTGGALGIAGVQRLRGPSATPEERVTRAVHKAARKAPAVQPA